MEETGYLSRDLAVILAFAGAAALVFSKLRLPFLIGYIAVGILISPILGIISDSRTIAELGELGILFMMFFVGLEFNLNRLKKVIVPAFFAIACQTAVMMAVGVAAAGHMGMDFIAGLFLGGLLSVSSTIVLVEIFEQKGHLNRPYAQLATGVLILEDLLAIIMLVVLSGVAISRKFDWNGVWHVCFMLISLFAAIFAAGKVFLPPILRKIGAAANPQVLMIFSLAFIFGLGELAKSLNFSTALGAFLAGSILSGSAVSRQTGAIIGPYKNFFVAIFFVSVGTMIDPAQILGLWKPILALSALVFAGQSLGFFAGALFAGAAAKTAWLAAINKARIGEFSFVIAALGSSLGVVSGSLTAIAMGVAFVTIFANPAFVRLGEAAGNFAAAHAGVRARRMFEAYENTVRQLFSGFAKTALWKAAGSPIAQMAAFFLLGNAVVIVASILSGSGFVKSSPYGHGIKVGIWAAAGVLILPFSLAMMAKLNQIIAILMNLAIHGGEGRSRVSRRALGVLRMTVSVAVSLVFVMICMANARDYLPRGAAFIYFAVTNVSVGVIFAKYFLKVNVDLETRFVRNFNSHLKNDESYRREKLANDIKEKYPWPITISEFDISSGTAAAGRTIRELQIRKKSGATVVALEREGLTRFDLVPDMPLFPGDTVVIIGDEGQTRMAGEILSARGDSGLPAAGSAPGDDAFEVEYAYVGADFGGVGRTLMELKLTRKYGVSIVGIQRGATKIISPGAGERIKSGDVLLLVGRREDASAFRDVVQNGGNPAPRA